MTESQHTATLESLAQDIADLRGELRGHIRNMDSAFPKHPRTGETDYLGHGDFHTELIKRAAVIEGRREELLRKFLAGSFYATVVVLSGWTLHGFIQWFKEHLK